MKYIILFLLVVFFVSCNGSMYEDDNIIDYVIHKQIHPSLPDFEFRLLGLAIEDNGFEYVQIHTLVITNDSLDLRQEFTGLTTEDIPLFLNENYSYGLSFDDWNFDGFLDISLLKHHTMQGALFYFWLWDNELGLFVQNEYLQDLSGASIYPIHEEGFVEVTSSGGVSVYSISRHAFEDGRFVPILHVVVLFNPSGTDEHEFTRIIYKQIHESLPVFEFRLDGRYNYEHELFDYVEVNKLTVICEEIGLWQEFDDLQTIDTENVGLYTVNPSWLHFEDWNLDGYLDISLFKHPGGTMGNATHYYWLWDVERGEFVEVYREEE
jgi:hypothetical protein